MSEDTTSPSHYKWHPAGIEAIEVTEYFSKNLGCAIDYIWRAGRKTPDPREDLSKAIWYLKREITRFEKFDGVRDTDPVVATEAPKNERAREEARAAIAKILAGGSAGLVV